MPASVRYRLDPLEEGVLLVARSAKGLVRVAFGFAPASLGAALRGCDARPDRGDRLLAAAAERIRSWFDDPATPLDDLPLDPPGTPFQLRVWAELRRLRAGEVVSYGALAARIGRPRAARAVGAACRANPLLFVIPCHRVVGSRDLGGFGRLGLAFKRRLLAREGVTFAAPPSPL